jgi:hypothetical protein
VCRLFPCTAPRSAYSNAGHRVFWVITACALHAGWKPKPRILPKRGEFTGYLDSARSMPVAEYLAPWRGVHPKAIHLDTSTPVCEFRNDRKLRNSNPLAAKHLRSVVGSYRRNVPRSSKRTAREFGQFSVHFLRSFPNQCRRRQVPRFLTGPPGS